MEIELIRDSTTNIHDDIDNDADAFTAGNNIGTADKSTYSDGKNANRDSFFARSKRVCCVPDFEVDRLLLLMDAFLGMSVCIPSVLRMQ